MKLRNKDKAKEDKRWTKSFGMRGIFVGSVHLSLAWEETSPKSLSMQKVYNILMWKTRNLSTFLSFPHNNVILFRFKGN